MPDEPEVQPDAPQPHDDGYHPVPPLDAMIEDECGDPAEEAMRRQSSISTHRNQDEGPDLAPD